jgi:mannose-6-phosphate isomerase-like protein (cupin superfamily)
MPKSILSSFSQSCGILTTERAAAQFARCRPATKEAAMTRDTEQQPAYRVANIETVVAGSDVQARLFTLAPEEVIPWHFHSEVTDWYFVLAGTLSIETRAPRDECSIAVGGSYRIPPKTAHLISNKGGAPCRFLLLQGTGKYDFVKIGG